MQFGETIMNDAQNVQDCIEVKFNNEVFHGNKCENRRMHCVRNVYLIKEDILFVKCLFYHCGCSPPGS